MNRLTLLSLVVCCYAYAVNADAAAPGVPSETVAVQLRDEAMAGKSIAYSWVSELSTRIGPRPAGSTNEQRAAVWAADKFKALGFENVQIQTFPLVAWVRGSERGEITAPDPQPLALAALGESPPTPEGGLEADVVVFPSFDDLLTVPSGSLTGKIVMINRRMVRTQDISGYAAVAGARVRGPVEAARRGAIGFLIRSIGTDNHRLPHTGAMSYVDGHPSIPAFALSAPDADQIERLIVEGRKVRVRLSSTASFVRDTHSQNVIAEIRGQQRPEEVILLGAHLDSWDLGTGASDDGAGAAIITAAAKLIRDLPPKPRRTVRVVLFGAEAVSQPVAPFSMAGGNAYAKKYAAELSSHILASESDTGADRIYALGLTASTPNRAEFTNAVFRVLAPLGILSTDSISETGADIGPLLESGVPSFGFYNDVSRYFDLHHTADDTLDKIDPQQLDQNVAAWAVMTWFAADSAARFEPRQASAGKETGIHSFFQSAGQGK